MGRGEGFGDEMWEETLVGDFGVKIKMIESNNGCINCAFIGFCTRTKPGGNELNVPQCKAWNRVDGKDVIFILTEMPDGIKIYES